MKHVIDTHRAALAASTARATLLAALALCLAPLASCTFNVTAIDREISATSTPSPSQVEVDLVPIESRIPRTELRVTGTERTDALATAHLVGLQGSASELDALLMLWSIGLTARDVGVGLDLGAPASSSELWLEDLDVDVPAAADVVVRVESTSVSATHLEGRVEATATSGSIDVETTGAVDLEASSGSIDARALAGAVRTTSGSIDVDFDGWITASASSGSIRGVIGDGGSAEASSGSIVLTLRRALARDLTVSTTSGSVVIEVPPGAPTHLDLMTDSGGVSVDVGGVRYDGARYLGDLAGGGPTLHVRASSGSIHVREPR